MGMDDDSRSAIQAALESLASLGADVENAYEGTVQVLVQFHEIASVYSDLAKRFAETVAPVLARLAKLSERLALVEAIGEAQYVLWEPLPDELCERLSVEMDGPQLLDEICAWHEGSGFSQIEKTIILLSSEPLLEGNAVFAQSVVAFHQDMYDIAVLGFTAVTDRLLSVCSGSIVTNIQRRVKQIEDRLGSIDEFLDNCDIGDYALFLTYDKALPAFGAFAPFDGDEPDLNRHWIAHGRMNREMSRMDCIRIINFLYGTILMSRLVPTRDDMN